MSSRIYLLIKVFDNEEYADAFLHKGELFCRTLGEFKNIEDDQARGDKYEGVTDWHQPDQVKLVLSYKDSEGIEHSFPIDELAGPLIMQNNGLNRLNLFCMYAVKIEVPDETYETREELLEAVDKVNDSLASRGVMNDQVLAFGQHAVIIYNVQGFFKRVEHAAESLGAAYMHGSVKYYDPETFHGSFEGVQAAFRKRNTYAYQNEYRLLFDFPEANGEQTLHVGSLADIACKLSATEINTGVQLKLSSLEEPDVTAA